MDNENIKMSRKNGQKNKNEIKKWSKKGKNG